MLRQTLLLSQVLGCSDPWLGSVKTAKHFAGLSQFEIEVEIPDETHWFAVGC